MSLPEMPKVEIKEVAMPTQKIQVKESDDKNDIFSKAIKKMLRKNGMDIWSYSRLSTWKQCKYEYFLNYIKYAGVYPRIARDNVYGVLGGIVHSCLESYFKGECKKEDMLSRFELIYNDTKIPKQGQTSILQFPSENVEKNYIECLRLFFRDYELPKAPITRNEDFVWELFNNNTIAMQGFIDLVLGYVNEDGSKYAVIQDFKTSTKFSPSDMLEKGRQLVVYAHMYTERTGIPVTRVEWNMLKYCEMTLPTTLSSLKAMKASELQKICNCRGKKNELVKIALKANLYELEPKTIVYQRNEIGLKMEKIITRYLIECDIPQDRITKNIILLKEHQHIKYMEKDILELLYKLGFKQNDYICKYPLTEEIYDDMENFIIQTVKEIESLPKIDKDETDLVLINQHFPHTNINQDAFYCSNLCGYAKDKNGVPICQFYQNYLKSL